jgi:uncharacterized protein
MIAERPIDHQAADATSHFLAQVRMNPVNAALLDRLPGLDLPDCWLVAGCLFQTIWNVRSGRSPTENIRDYDVFYFDDSDLSYAAEDRVIKRVAAAFSDLDATIEVKNQARVHLWYRQRFGQDPSQQAPLQQDPVQQDYPPLTSSCDGIDRFLVACTCVGIRCSGADASGDIGRALYAPNGLDDLVAGILVANNTSTTRFHEKARSYQARWPSLRLRPPIVENG